MRTPEEPQGSLAHRAQIFGGPQAAEAQALEQMMIGRSWRPSARQGVALADRTCFSDTLWPQGPEAKIFEFALSLIPGAIARARADLRQEAGIRSFHALQVNRYDPVI